MPLEVPLIFMTNAGDYEIILFYRYVIISSNTTKAPNENGYVESIEVRVSENSRRLGKVKKIHLQPHKKSIK